MVTTHVRVSSPSYASDLTIYLRGQGFRTTADLDADTVTVLAADHVELTHVLARWPLKVVGATADIVG